jgi:hypothetical protein
MPSPRNPLSSLGESRGQVVLLWPMEFIPYAGATIIRQLKFRSRLMGIGLAVLSRFVLAFEILYLSFHYSQSFRARPLSVFLRRWTPQAEWLFREYNELPHLFQGRITRGYDFANTYIGLFPQPFLQRFLRVIDFFSRGLITLLFVAVLITDSRYLLTFEIVKGKPRRFEFPIESIYCSCIVAASIVLHALSASVGQCRSTRVLPQTIPQTHPRDSRTHKTGNIIARILG